MRARAWEQGLCPRGRLGLGLGLGSGLGLGLTRGTVLPMTTHLHVVAQLLVGRCEVGARAHLHSSQKESERNVRTGRTGGGKGVRVATGIVPRIMHNLVHAPKRCAALPLHAEAVALQPYAAEAAALQPYAAEAAALQPHAPHCACTLPYMGLQRCSLCHIWGCRAATSAACRVAALQPLPHMGLPSCSLCRM